MNNSNSQTTVNIPNYEITETVYLGSRTLVYRAVRIDDKFPVVIKLLKRQYPTFSELVQFRNQYTIAKNLEIPGIIKPYNLEPYQNGYALVMEDFGGISLERFTLEKPLTLEQFLLIAIQLADTLQQLHQYGVIHKDIKPANILIQAETLEVKLIDFSISSLLPKETPEIENPNVLEGTLAYLSPEQTGRMNRGIDYRSDFYSLGVTFYELLIRELPFQSSDPMELVHYHIAKASPLVHEINSKIPSVLSEIIEKLMAKNAEDRYQSALGLKYDLEKCLTELQKTGEIESFEIGRRDLCDRLIIPDKLYGRETSVKTLLQAFERVSNPPEGRGELMLVAGFSGIGKTAVVNEVHKPIVRKLGYFIKGKYDQFQRNIPFSAFVQAFRDLMEQLLTESETKIQQWKSKILEAIGENGQVIIEVIPELERIMGEQPPAIELSGTAAQNRFNLLFQKFTQVFTTAEHPLVIFLDDLQWADSASLKLMQLLMADTGHLFLIGAYRDNEVNPAHPLMLTLSEIEKTAAIHTITLKPLSQRQINQLVADTLKCTEKFALPLSELVYKKTQGNPFFATQFLKALYQDGLIKFNLVEGCWQCDLPQINQQALTDDVVEFMALQLQKLPEVTQNVLKLAACIGNQFDLATLAIVSEHSEIETAASLWKALQEGLILPQSEVYKFYVGEVNQAVSQEHSQIVSYKFLHDRVQQAAYSLIPSDEKQPVHLKIGQLLRNNIPETHLEDRIFEIVSQLNIAVELITQLTERQELAQFNLMASRKAKAATAYLAALKYAKLGINLLAENCWQTQYELTLTLHQIATEAAYLGGDLEQMETLGNKILNHAKTPFDQVRVYQVKIEALTAQGQFTEAIATALAILQQLGVELPATPSPEDVETAFKTVSDAIAGRSPNELLNLPQATDVNILAAARILTSAAPVAYLSEPQLYLLVVLKKVYLSVVYGNESTSPFAYASYGILMCGVIRNVELGYEFGQLALDLLSHYPNSELKGKTLLLVYVYTRHWKIHLRETLNPLQNAYCTCLDLGDLAFAGYSAWIYSLNAYFSGENLPQLESEISRYCEALNQLRQTVTLTYSQLTQQILLNLMGERDNVLLLSGTAYNEQHQLPLHETSGDRTGLGLFWINKLVVSYLFSDFEGAVEQVEKAKQYLDALLAFVYVPIFHFYESLAYLAVLGNCSSLQQQQMNESIANNQEKLKDWATYAPMNFQHKFDLVEAERYRVLGQKTEAIEYYDRAISGAKENGFIQEEALANELAAKFYLDWGKEKVAQVYIQEAYYCYTRWGAKAKVIDLEQRYPQLLTPLKQQRHSPFSIKETITASLTAIATSSSCSISDSFDLAAILKASQTLSREIELDKLLSTLLQVVIENAGADKAVLILSEEQGLMVQAVSGIDCCPVLSLPHPVEDSQELPTRLIYTVQRSLKPVVIFDARIDPQFINDAYIQKHLLKSILCSPILHQGKLIGMVYLENNLATGAFTSDRVKILNILCAQAAISLENARLYTQAQEKSQALEQSEKRYRFLATATSQMIWLANVSGENTNTVHWMEYTGQTEEEVQGTGWLNAIHPDDISHTVQDWTHAIETKSIYQTEYRIRGADGNYRYFAVRGVPLLAEDGSIYEWIGTCTDIDDRKKAEAAVQQKSQELEKALQDLQQAQLQIVQSEKMSALGNLVAGVAHEMNNPLGFIFASLKQAQPTIAALVEHLKLYQKSLPNPSDEIQEHAEKIDLDYSLEDLPKMLDSMLIACDRLKNISTSLRTFSRADKDYKVPFNIHEGIDSTLLILKHRLKANDKRPGMEVVTDYGNLPKVECFPGQLNQVFMNILSNAIDALDESNIGRSFAEIQANPNLIIIKTSVENENVKIIITDNGHGINEAVKPKIFDHLFTTKAVGKGTGLGLAIARQIVVEKHKGLISVNSTLGHGTKFEITLPIK
ncbi:AAA family ATPase [Limnoraphis robusta]|uniref:AAA family ATPase n=1 Tax=Limnoraphis robusta TaxID=1118279 RepID=UPI002B1EB16A|nr:AAA family ATPase [Limnoraphis robusta]MEA5500093.1 AAA family ATPase [Limnoraphis robusta BA-68 BA1]